MAGKTQTLTRKTKEKMKRNGIIWSMLASALLLCACGGEKRQTGREWLRSNDVVIAVDETFRPVMSEAFDLFASEHLEATMKPLYCSEDSALRLLCADTLRAVVVTRMLTDNEKALLAEHKLSAKQALIAHDAFALITSRDCPDSLLTLDDLRGIVSGRITRWEQLSHAKRSGELRLVFDHSGSSTVRYMRDSLNAGRPLSGNLFAQGSNAAVIEAVQDNPDIIGVVGTDWLRSPKGPVLGNFSELPVSVMKVARRADEDAFYCRPYQAYIATADYPLIRSVYVITTDPRERSQTKSLYFFLKGQKGQTLICNSSQLLPNSPVQLKYVNIKD